MEESSDPKLSLGNTEVVMLLFDHFKNMTMQNNAYQRELTLESNAYQRTQINEKIEFAIEGLCREIVKVKDVFENQASLQVTNLSDHVLKTDTLNRYLEERVTTTTVLYSSPLFTFYPGIRS